MKEIILNRVHKNSPNYKKYSALVDNEDFEKVNKYNWHVKKDWDSLYAISSIGGKHIRLHVFIMGFVGIDHIDGNGLNNQKANLRKATQQENGRNRRIPKNTSSKFKGVSWHKKNRKWVAYISYNPKRTHLGYFASETEAARTYNEYAKKHFGEFARLNII